MVKTKLDKHKQFGLIAIISLGFFIGFFVSRFFIQAIIVQGDSMYPTYKNFQIALIDKYHRSYSAGDVVVIKHEQLGSTIVKRVVAVPEDDIVIKNGNLLVNGVQSVVFPYDYFRYEGMLNNPLTLLPHEYIVIGDNIEHSIDSRYAEVGIIDEEDIVGKIIQFS